MSTDQYLELEGISKRYGDVVALEALSLEVPAGELVGFVGRNGAGKTTAMRIIVGVLSADSANVRFGGTALTFDARRRIGYMPRSAASTRRCAWPSWPISARCMA
jgi:ABC-2 type transport system ATP-binding protein